ncbi:hypothetical protein C3941_17775 [Kaistia algarum]|nr:hypothetical protein C3941_17775 [Kaistia algarum]
MGETRPISGAAGGAHAAPLLTRPPTQRRARRIVDEVVRLTASYLTRLLRLAFLAPEIITAVLDGRQPLELSANKLMADTRLPIDRAGQRQTLGFR